jgi:murein L,D-transpeptidase YafK
MATIVTPFLALLLALQSATLVIPRVELSAPLSPGGSGAPLPASTASTTATPSTSASAGASAATKPVITEIRIGKRAHRLDLLAGKDVVRSYAVAIGSGGAGPKRFEGDKTTPVGTYKVSGRFKGLFHRFLVVSYPSEEDRARFAELKAKGEVPAGRGVGHGIGIHGVGGKQYTGVHKDNDWTHGCIALDDDEIDEVASMVKDGTRIVITD